jgi:hypothetical protein
MIKKTLVKAKNVVKNLKNKREAEEKEKKECDCLKKTSFKNGDPFDRAIQSFIDQLPRSIKKTLNKKNINLKDEIVQILKANSFDEIKNKKVSDDTESRMEFNTCNKRNEKGYLQLNEKDIGFSIDLEKNRAAISSSTFGKDLYSRNKIQKMLDRFLEKYWDRLINKLLNKKSCDEEEDPEKNKPEE